MLLLGECARYPNLTPVVGGSRPVDAIFKIKKIKNHTGYSFRVFEFQQRKGKKRTVTVGLKTEILEGSVNGVHVNALQ